jgi:hypothetical protein
MNRVNLDIAPKTRKKRYLQAIAETEEHIRRVIELRDKKSSITPSTLDTVREDPVIELPSREAVESSITPSTLDTVRDNPVIELPQVTLGTYHKKGKDYYRVSYRQGRSTHHIHIKGGSVGSPQSDSKAREIRDAIASKKNREDILSLLE